MTVGSGGGGGRRRRRRRVRVGGAAVCGVVVRVHVRQLHSSSDLWLVGVVFLQVASQRAVVAPTVRTVLPPAHLRGPGASDVDVDVVVDVGGRGHQSTSSLGPGGGRRRSWAGKG